MVPDVLMLLCDTARADAFLPLDGPISSPVVEQLAREGAWYSQAVSPAPWTLPSTASIFSGRLPTEHGVTIDCIDWSGSRPTSPAEAIRAWSGSWLPEEMRLRGYATWAASCNTWVSTWGGFDRGFDEFLDLNDRVRLPRGRIGAVVRRARRLYGNLDHGGRAAADRFRRRLREAGSRPLFAFVNLMEVHSPLDPPRPYYPFPFWRRPSTFRMSGGGKGPRPFLLYNLRLAEPPPEFVRTIRDLYFSAARYEDWLLGRFVAAVRERGRPTVVVVASDHGENLGEHGLFGHNSSLAETLLHVPLVTWGHGVDVAAGEVGYPVQVSGVTSWLTRMAEGADGEPLATNGAILSEYESTNRWIPHQVQGHSPEEVAAAAPPLASQAGLAVRKGHLKYLALERGEDALHDLIDDPGEERNLLEGRPDAAEEFLPFRRDWERRRREQPRYLAGAEADQEIAEHLRTLGYIE
jgi:arylsulfatase A-like enzyme